MNFPKSRIKILVISLAIFASATAVIVSGSILAWAHHSGPGLVADIKGYGLAVGKSGAIQCDDGKASTKSYARSKLPNYTINWSSGYWRFRRNK